MQAAKQTPWFRRVVLGIGIVVLASASPAYAVKWEATAEGEVKILDSDAPSAADRLSPAEFFKQLDQESELVSDAIAGRLYSLAVSQMVPQFEAWQAWGNRLARMSITATRLARNGRIRFVRAEVALELCRRSFPKGDCEEMQGFYMPLNDKIYLVGTSAAALETQPGIPATFYHEVVHAYQYSTRYGFDFAYLSQLDAVKKSGISPADLLAFFYEAQSHWYSIRHFDPAPWKEVHVSSSVLRGTTTQFIWLPKAMLHGMSLGISGKVFQKEFVGYLPKIDLLDDFNGYLRPNEESAFWFHEPILFRSRTKVYNPGSMVDFKFHRIFTNAVERTYYDSEGYQAGREGKWLQSIFRNLNDLAYGMEAEAGNHEWQAVPCSGMTIHQVMETQRLVPYEYWKTRITESDFQACLAEGISRHIPKKHRKIDAAPQGLKISQFWLRGEDEGHGGSEGSHGDLLIHPQFPVLPERGK